MALTAAQLTALNTELTTDPLAIGYPLGDDTTTAVKLNAVIVGNIVKRKDIMAAEVLEAIDTADFQTTPAPVMGAISWFESATQQQRLQLVNEDGTDTNVLKNLKQLFLPNGAAGANPQTRARLNAIALRDGSRAEKLFGAGTVVSSVDVQHALGR